MKVNRVKVDRIQGISAILAEFERNSGKRKDFPRYARRIAALPTERIESIELHGFVSIEAHKQFITIKKGEIMLSLPNKNVPELIEALQVVME